MFTTKAGSSSFSISATPKKKMNSSKQFVAELKSNPHNIFNKSFDTAEQLLNKSCAPNLKQTKLGLRKASTSSKRLSQETDAGTNEVAIKKVNGRNQERTEIFLLPAPKQRIIEIPLSVQKTSIPICQRRAIEAPNIAKTENQQQNSSNVLSRKGRNMVVVIGKVDFCLKMRKKHPDLNIMYDVYGKLVKVIHGKLSCEYILLLRNDEKGPILQSVYFDFNGIVEQFDIGTYLRAVGHCIGESRLQTFKLQKIDMWAWQQNFMRVQNVTSFVLLQQGMQEMK